MPGIGETLTTRMGPLPVWAWTGLGVGGLGFYLYHQRTKNAKAQADQANADNQGLSSNLGTVPVSNLTTAAQPMPIQMGDTFVDVQPSPTTVNTTVNPPNVTIQPPVQGPPKQPPPPPSKVTNPKPPVTTMPVPKKPAPPKAPAQRTVQVCAWPSWCGSLWGIAQHYYGNGADWPKIYNANKAKIGANPNLIHTGTTLVIP